MQPTYFVKHPDYRFTVADPQPISVANIDELVNRFLCWKLTKDFAPDGGVSFAKTYLGCDGEKNPRVRRPLLADWNEPPDGRPSAADDQASARSGNRDAERMN